MRLVKDDRPSVMLGRNRISGYLLEAPCHLTSAGNKNCHGALLPSLILTLFFMSRVITQCFLAKTHVWIWFDEMVFYALVLGIPGLKANLIF